MKVQLVQLPVTPDIEENIRLMTESLDPACDLAVLPELWNCPYDNDRIRDAARWDECCLQAMSQAAREKGLWLTGSLPVRQKDRLYNMAVVFDDRGQEVCRYAKTHLMEVHTASGGYSEKEVFAPGEGFTTFETPWGRMGLLICYDIRFPEPARLLADAGARVLLVPAAFNEAVGRKHWEPLLRARALENQVFVVGVNPDYTWKRYRAWGHSLAVSPDGIILQEGAGIVDLDLAEIDRIRERMPYSRIRRRDLYRIESGALLPADQPTDTDTVILDEEEKA